MAAMTQMAGTRPQVGRGAGRLLRHALLGGAISAVVNLALYFGARAAGVTMTGQFEGAVVGVLPVTHVIFSSVVPALAATLVMMSLMKFTSAPIRNFTILAVAVCLFSLMGPIGVKQLSFGMLVVMELMHVVASVCIGGLVVRAVKRQ